MSEPNRFLICGYHGFGNIGDESILEAMVSKLREKFKDPPAEIVVLSNKPEETENQHGVIAVDRWNPARVIRELYKADLFISGGGGLLQDSTSWRSVWYYWFSLAGAWLTRTPYVLLGQGIGPLRHRFNRAVTGFLLRRARFFLVRDQKSVDFLQDHGVGEEEIVESPDLAFITPNDGGKKERIFAAEDGPRVGVALKDLENNREQLMNMVAQSVDALAEERELNSVLFSTHPSSDLPIIADLREKMEGDPTVLDTDHLTGRDLVHLIEDLDLVIAGRLHALIFSILAHTPCLVISYDKKMDHLVDALSSRESSPELKSWNPGELYQADLFYEDLTQVLSSGPRIRSQLEDSVLDVKRQAERGLEEALDRVQEVLSDEV